MRGDFNQVSEKATPELVDTNFQHPLKQSQIDSRFECRLF